MNGKKVFSVFFAFAVVLWLETTVFYDYGQGPAGEVCR
jgi:hypothetical protein